jgi:hypothetical protein
VRFQNLELLPLLFQYVPFRLARIRFPLLLLSVLLVFPPLRIAVSRRRESRKVHMEKYAHNSLPLALLSFSVDLTER